MPPLHLKQEFGSLKGFKDALYVWAIEEHFEPRILKSDSHHVRVGCKFDPKCEFSIRCNAYNASPRVPQPYAKITVLRHEHTCTRSDPTNPLNRQVANRIPWLLENVPKFLEVTPDTSIDSIQEAILAQSGYTVNMQQIRRVRRLLVKGKDFRSPQRSHEIVSGVGGGQQQQAHSHQHSHPQHPQHTSQGVNGGHIQHAPPSSNPNLTEDFSTTSARLSNNQFEDHSTLIGTLTDQGQNQIQVPSNNMFDVNNPPPPRIIEVPVMSNAPPPSRQHVKESPVRCPFCVNVRWMKSIKDAVDHMGMHVV